MFNAQPGFGDRQESHAWWIDEYDKPLLDMIEDQELVEHNRAVFKGFFSSLKSFDEYLQFVFITGVTKFNKVGIFSDLNQLYDITFSNAFAGICGITEDELKECFMPEIEEMATVRKTMEEYADDTSVGSGRDILFIDEDIFI